MDEISKHGDSFLFWEIRCVEVFRSKLSLKCVLMMISKISCGDVDDLRREYIEEDEKDEDDEMFLIFTSEFVW